MDIFRSLPERSPSSACVNGSEEKWLRVSQSLFKDDSVVANPGILNPDVVEALGKVDPEVQAAERSPRAVRQLKAKTRMELEEVNP